MQEIYEKILEMREQQESEAGPLFAELSTPETWLELLRWLIQNESSNFDVQMTEIAAMALWALETAGKKRESDAFALETSCETPPSASYDQRFGPVDQMLGFSRRKRF